MASRHLPRWRGGMLRARLIAGAKLGGLQGLVLGWTLAVSVEGACAALTLALAMKLDSAAGPVHGGPPVASPSET